jgi:DNA replicative helicase MCM subunit Mcm2 (Cdc46/Mcm family)
MSVLTYRCEYCNSKFRLEYEETECETDPLHCPFCSEYIDQEELDFDEDES